MKRVAVDPRIESGFVLPSAIFLLVMLAALGAYMVSLSRTSHLSSALDVQGVRAYQAARAGIEWAAWQVIPQASPTPCPAPSSTVVLGSAFSGFTVTVTCARTDATDGADPVAVYQITSTATWGAANEPDYVERRIEASFSK